MIENNKEKFEIIGKIDEKELKKAEYELGIQFGSNLKTLLLNYGCISYECFEIYGLGVENTSHLNIVTQTLELRKNNLPKKYIVFLNLGDGHYAVTDRDDNVYEFSREQEKIIKKLDDNFDNYLYNLFKKC